MKNLFKILVAVLVMFNSFNSFGQGNLAQLVIDISNGDEINIKIEEDSSSMPLNENIYNCYDVVKTDSDTKISGFNSTNITITFKSYTNFVLNTSEEVTLIPDSNAINNGRYTRVFKYTENNGDNSYLHVEFSTSQYNKIVDSTLAVNENTVTNLNIYPNPTVNYITIDFDNNQEVPVYVFSMNGKLMYKNVINHSIKLNMYNYPSGYYIVKVGTLTRKVYKR